MIMKRNIFNTCFYAVSIALLLISCKNPESKKVDIDTPEKIASRATHSLSTSFLSSQDNPQTLQQNLINIKASEGIEAETKIEQLKNAIKSADDIDKEVNQSLNSDILSKAYTGDELQKKQAFINELKSHKAYVYSKLRKQIFHNFQISSDGSTAKVDLTETWSHKIFSQSNELLAKSPASDVPQTNYLVRTKDGWLISHTFFGGKPPTFKIIASSQK
ncbi:hypothetical protein NIES4071_12680 [Calothrix sp. NIES-4071]|nr:hypothetical protein NIES4071_12680 [Calothrix sp. NIES-4071]BAZ55608.1 hypothetical protein NIES4105_12640 [Calothrix sp. NIES-4105]